MAVWGQEEVDRAWHLLSEFCETSEAAAYMGITDSEFERLCVYHFSDRFDETPTYEQIVERCRAAGRALVRLAQFDAMRNGDRSMLLAMGKEYLGQTGDGKPIEKSDASREETIVGNVLARYADAPDRKPTSH